MRRNARNSESAIASDSFLDVIANIVGILIILTVIAGLRVSQAPVVLTPDVDDAATDPLQPFPSEPESADVIADHVLVAIPPSEPDPVVEFPPLEILAQPVFNPLPGLMAAAGDLEREILNVDRQLATRERELAALSAEEKGLREKLQANSSRLEQERKSLEVGRSMVAQASSETDSIKSKLNQLQHALESARQESPPSIKLEHTVTPISNSVQGKELHFRMLEGRVSCLPIDELVERLKSQVEQRKDWLVKFNSHQGNVGPVDGYTMSYTVKRQDMSVVDELRYGRQMIQIVVSRWTLEPERGVPAETPDEALRANSRFMRKLRTADANTAVTFWVYPDSFGTYRRLQAAAHAEGYTVAARPIPFGVPISGSPQGTRSAGQ